MAKRAPLSEEHKARIREGMAKRAAEKAKKDFETNLETISEEGVPMEKKEVKATVEKKSVATQAAPQAGPVQMDALGMFLGSISDQIQQTIDTTVTGEFAELRREATKNAKLDVTFEGKTKTVKGLRHNQLEDLITVAALRLPVLMVGMAGTGKTHAAEQVAEALGLKFYTMSVGAQTSKSDIIGFIHANGGYVRSMFREAYENGGVFLMDEIDAGNANVLIQVNAALSNGLCAFPDAMVKKHKDFVFISSANTFGTGMNRQYVGRNQLDAATLDRFTVVEWDVDEKLEERIAVGVHGKAWYETVKVIRRHVAKHNIRALITPRATQKGSTLLSAGIHVKHVIPAVLLGSVPDDKKKEITELALSTFGIEVTDTKK